MPLKPRWIALSLLALVSVVLLAGAGVYFFIDRFDLGAMAASRASAQCRSGRCT
jgi:hypothetical protein